MTLPPNARVIVHFKPGNPNRTLDLGTRAPEPGSRKPRRWTRQAISGRSMHAEGDEAQRLVAAVEALPAKARAGFVVKVLEVAGDVAAVAVAVAEGNVPAAVEAVAELADDARELADAAPRRRRRPEGKPAPEPAPEAEPS